MAIIAQACERSKGSQDDRSRLGARHERGYDTASLRGEDLNRSHAAFAAIALLLILGVGGQGVVGGPAKLDPALRALLDSTSGADAISQGLLGDSSAFEWSLSPTGQPRLGVLVKTERTILGGSFLGIPIRGRAGTILALSATLAQVAALADASDVVYIEPSWRTQPSLDRSLPAVRADVVHAASPPILGDDVVIGVVDTGIDYTHLDFRYDGNADGTEESSRIHALWDQTWGLFGAEYTRSEIEGDLALGLGPDSGAVRSRDTNGHGTHVASIAAGDGTSSTNGFVGVAPGAWIVAVKTSFFTADIIRAVEYVFDQADALGLPAVVNLSLGGQEGPHDGTSLFEEGIDQLATGPGRIVVVSAGNEGDLSIHTSGDLNGNSKTFFVRPEEWELELSVWYPGGSQFSITVTAPGGESAVATTGVETGYVSTADGTLFIDNASGGTNPNNGDHEAFLRLANVAVGERWRVEITDWGGGGRFDAWVTTDRGTIEGGDSFSTIDEPGNGDRVITVGSFNSKSTWASLAGSQDYSAQYPVGAASDFSSLGPTRDGRTKPELSAPGAWVCAAGSEDAATFAYLTNPDGVHVMEIGTSMAAPHVSGAVALLLSIDPSLTTGEVRSLLTATASTDSNTGSIPNFRWGWGKLDVAAAIEDLGTPEPPGPPVTPSAPEIRLVSNPVSDEATFTLSIPEGATSASLRVFTIAGQLAYETSVAPGATEATWNLRSQSGRSLAVGLYFYVLVTDRGISEVGRLVIAR